MDGAGPSSNDIDGDEGYHSLPDSLPARLRGVREVDIRPKDMGVDLTVHHMMVVTATEVPHWRKKTFFVPDFPHEFANKFGSGDLFYTQDSPNAPYRGEWVLGRLEEIPVKDGSTTLVFNVEKSKGRESTDGYINLAQRLRYGTNPVNSGDPRCHLISNTLKTFEFTGVLVKETAWHRRGMLVMCRSVMLADNASKKGRKQGGFARVTQWVALANEGVFRSVLAFL